MGKSIKSECVIQILSQAQKHEQVLKFPTHILSAWSCSVSAHKRPRAACGLRGGNYLFIGSETGLVADWAGLSVCQDSLGRDQDCLDALDALFGPTQSALPQPPPMMVSQMSGRDPPPFRLLLLALRRLLEIVGKCMWQSISQKGGLLWINTHVSIICILLVPTSPKCIAD